MRRSSRVAALITTAIGAIGLMGWVLGSEPLKAAFTGNVSIKVNASFGLIFAGSALAMLVSRPDSRVVLSVARSFAWLTIGLGAATLLEHVVGVDFGIDELLFAEPPGAAATVSPGRMGPPASISLTLGGIALLLIDVRTRGGRAPAQWLALIIALIALLPLIGYAYSIQSLYGIARYTGIALHTAIALLALAIGLLLARPDVGLMSVLTSDDDGGAMARRLILPAILMPLALGWLRTIGQRRGWFDEAIGRPVLILTLITCLSALIWWNARSISRIGRQRLRAEGDRERLLGELGAEHTRTVDALAALRDSEQRLSVILGNAPVMIYLVDTEQRFRFINRRMESHLRLQNDQVAGKSLFDLFPREVAEQFAQNNRKVIETRQPFETEEFIPDAGGVRIYISVKVPLFDPAGNPHGICGISTDITDRKNSEFALRESEQRLQLAVAIAQMGTFEIDLRTDQVTVNGTGREIYGWAPDARLTFAHVQAHFHKDDRQRVMRTVQEAFDPSSAGEFEVEHRIIRTDGANAWLRVRGRALFDAIEGRRRAVRCVGTFIDITAQKLAERQREQLLAAERHARTQAEQANRLKDEFLATLSHELRTPLTPVLLTLSLLETRRDLPADVRQDVAVIRRNVELESRLISDLLDVTRIAKGKLDLDEQQVDLHLIIQSAIDICQRDASARLRTELHAPRHLVRGDSTRLHQIFWNLINNAIKFTGQAGEITVCSRNDPGGSRICVEVIDTGIGIDSAVLPRLFTAFEQGDVRAFRKHAGLGLGLAISRRLAEAHGGTIVAHSDGVGRGATFRVELPVLAVSAPTAAPPGPASAPPTARILSVLLVEDHEPTLTVMTKLLRGLGHHVVGATSVASAKAVAQQDGFDVIISDLGLPDGSGLDVMRDLRHKYANRAIALTGYGMESDIAASRDAGFADHLTKPVDLHQLQQAIQRITG